MSDSQFIFHIFRVIYHKLFTFSERIRKFLSNSTQGIDMGLYAEEMIQINARDSGLTYGELFRGQDLSLWNIDRGLSDVTLYAISLSDFNRAMTLQGKAPYSLGEDEFLLNCNYEGNLGYVRTALEQTHKLVIAGTELKSASDAPLEETWFMTSVGNNDRGTLIVPDRIAENLSRDMNVLLVRFKPDADSRELIQKLIPIGLDDAHSYRYMEKKMMYDTYFRFQRDDRLPVHLPGRHLPADLRRRPGAQAAHRDS